MFLHENDVDSFYKISSVMKWGRDVDAQAIFSDLYRWGLVNRFEDSLTKKINS